VMRRSSESKHRGEHEATRGVGWHRGFGGLFALDTSKYTSPVLVASADGVGTKLDIARQVGRYDSVGIDLVAMLVDDLACVGAEPLFLLDYVAVGKLEPARLEELVTGIAKVVDGRIPHSSVARPPSTPGHGAR